MVQQDTAKTLLFSKLIHTLRIDFEDLYCVLMLNHKSNLNSREKKIGAGGERGGNIPPLDQSGNIARKKLEILRVYKITNLQEKKSKFSRSKS